MIKMELAKFMFKFINKTLPNSFNNFFLRLDKIHKHNIRQKKNVMNIFNRAFCHYLPKIMKNFPQELRHRSFHKSKIFFKTDILKTHVRLKSEQ